jgi:hypothetical protein
MAIWDPAICTQGPIQKPFLYTYDGSFYCTFMNTFYHTL